MKLSIIAILLFSLISCREEEGIWDKLSPSEQAALRARATTKCMDESDSFFDDFKTRSGDRFYGSGGYVAGTTFNHTFKEGSATDYTHKITVWKVTATDVYFLIEVDDSTDEYKFLKIPKATNDAMITDLQTKYCDKSAAGKEDGFSLSTSGKTYTQTRKTSSKDLTYTFTFSSSLPAFFSKYKESTKEQPLDANGNATGTATTLTGTLSNSTTETNIPKYDTFAEYVATGTRTTLCIVNYASIPYDTTCTLDGTGTFPSSEL